MASTTALAGVVCRTLKGCKGRKLCRLRASRFSHVRRIRAPEGSSNTKGRQQIGLRQQKTVRQSRLTMSRMPGRRPGEVSAALRRIALIIQASQT